MKSFIAVVLLFALAYEVSGAIVANRTRVSGSSNVTFFLYNDQLTLREALQTCIRADTQMANYWWGRHTIQRMAQKNNITQIWSNAAIQNRTDAVTLLNWNRLGPNPPIEITSCVVINTTRSFGLMSPSFVRQNSTFMPNREFIGFPRNGSSINENYITYITRPTPSSPPRATLTSCNQRYGFVCVRINPYIPVGGQQLYGATPSTASPPSTTRSN